MPTFRNQNSGCPHSGNQHSACSHSGNAAVFMLTSVKTNVYGPTLMLGAATRSPSTAESTDVLGVSTPSPMMKPTPMTTSHRRALWYVLLVCRCGLCDIKSVCMHTCKSIQNSSSGGHASESIHILALSRVLYPDLEPGSPAIGPQGGGCDACRPAPMRLALCLLPVGVGSQVQVSREGRVLRKLKHVIIAGLLVGRGAFRGGWGLCVRSNVNGTLELGVQGKGAAVAIVVGAQDDDAVFEYLWTHDVLIGCRLGERVGNDCFVPGGALGTKIYRIQHP